MHNFYVTRGVKRLRKSLKELKVKLLLLSSLSIRFHSVRDGEDKRFQWIRSCRCVSRLIYIRFFRHILSVKFASHHIKLALWKIAAIIIIFHSSLYILSINIEIFSLYKRIISKVNRRLEFVRFSHDFFKFLSLSFQVHISVLFTSFKMKRSLMKDLKSLKQQVEINLNTSSKKPDDIKNIDYIENESSTLFSSIFWCCCAAQSTETY